MILLCFTAPSAYHAEALTEALKSLASLKYSMNPAKMRSREVQWRDRGTICAAVGFADTPSIWPREHITIGGFD